MALYSGFEHISNGMRMIHYISDHDMGFRLHTNIMLEVRCFFGGKGTHYVEGIEYTEQPGDVLIVRPGESHYPIVDMSVPYERSSILVTPELMRSIIGNDILLEPFYNRQLGTQNLYHADAFDRDPRYYFRKMTQPSPDQRANILAYTILLLQQLSTAYRKKQFAAPPTTSPGQQVIQYIDQNLEQELSIDALCEEFFISSAQLSRIVKKVSGVSVGQYITVKRLAKAQYLILKGHKPTQICAACGYPNYASFYRAYTKHFGRTPKEEFLSSTIEDKE